MTQLVLFIACSLLLYSATKPAEAIEVRRNSAGRTVVMDRDDGNLRLDVIDRDANGWPARIVRRTFGEVANLNAAARTYGFFILPRAEIFPAEGLGDAKELRDAGVAPLWEATNVWDEAWERKYSEWVERNVDRDYLVRAQQPSDCADLVYIARWVFARENGLPVANRLAGTGDYLSQRSVKREWADLPVDADWKKDRRFRAAIKYLLSLVYTHSLMGDSYPIALDPAVFRAGVHHLSLTKTSGHTLLVYRTDYVDSRSLPFRVFYSTLPIVIRPLIEQAYFYTDQPKADTGGFLRMRWPLLKNGAYVLARAEDMPGFSLEQYDPKLIEGQRSFGLAVMRRLKPTFSLVVAIREAIDGVRDMIRDRARLVEDGFAACSKLLDGCPTDSQAYDDWSTTNRDARLLAQSDLLRSMISLGNTDERTQMQSILNAELAKPALDLGGESISLDLVYQALRRKIASDDPNLPIERRWNVRPEGLVPFFRERLVAGYAARAKALQRTSACRLSAATECRPGGSKFETENTYGIDTALKQLPLYASAYCATAGLRDAKCARLQSQLRDTALTIDGRSRSLGEWIDATLWLNSDPRASLAERSELNEVYQRLEITGTRDFHLRDRLAFLRDRDSFRGTLYDRSSSGFAKREFAAGTALLDADLERGAALFSHDGRLVLADLNAADESAVASYAKPIVEARLLGDALSGFPRVLVFFEGEWRLLERGSPGAWKEILTGTFREKAAMDPKFDREFLVLHSSVDPVADWSIVDLKAPAPRAIAFTGKPNIGDSNRQSLALRNTIYLQLVQRDASGEILRTLRVNRSTATAETSAWGLRGFVGHVTDDESTAYFTDIDGGSESVYSAPIGAEGKLGAWSKISNSFYRQADYIIFYGGIPTMLFYAITPGGVLRPMALQPTESWFKHVRAGSIVVAMKDGNYGIRNVDSLQTRIQDAFLAIPRAGAAEDEYRFLVRGWRSLVTNYTASVDSTFLTDQRFPERGAIATGMFLGDSLVNEPEPWSVDTYAGVDSVSMDRGVVVNLGMRAFWIGDR